MSSNQLEKIAEQALEAGLLLRVQVRRPFNLWTLRLVVAEQLMPGKIKIWGEMKAWAYGRENGLQLDTMRINPKAPRGVAHIVWAGTMAWALGVTPCKRARLLAISDDDRQHARLVRYFLKRGFQVVREVGSAPMDLPLRMVWGGAGSLMAADCRDVFQKSYQLWETSQKLDSKN